MGRHTGGGSYGHGIQKLEEDCFRLSWTVDRYYQGARLRYPRVTTRETDRAGAERFAKNWDVKMPEERT